LVKTGQEHHWTLRALAEEYAQLSQGYRQRLEQCLGNVQHAHRETCTGRAALKLLPWTQACRQAAEACEAQMVRLETLRRQLHATLSALP
jgi:hypothetical protein